MVNYEDKYIFIHIPRTGGTSIEYVLNNNKPIPVATGIQHWKYIDYINNISNIEKYYIFSVIRNPWDRLLSIYNEPNNPFIVENQTFNNWINQFSNIGNRNILMSQYSYLIDQNGWIRAGTPRYNYKDDINYICKFENLQEDFDIVCDRLNIKNKKLSHINKTNHIHYTDIYTDESKKIVENLYYDDIGFFGYKFGD